MNVRCGRDITVVQGTYEINGDFIISLDKITTPYLDVSSLRNRTDMNVTYVH